MLRGGASGAVRLVRPSVPYVAPSDVILNMRRAGGCGSASGATAGAVTAASRALRSAALVVLEADAPTPRSTARTGDWGLAAPGAGPGATGWRAVGAWGGGVGPGSAACCARGAGGGDREGAMMGALTLAGDRSAGRMTARAM